MSFKNRLSSGKFTVLAEMNTPKGIDISEIMNNAKRIKERVDAVIVPDMDNGVMKMSAIAGGVLVNRLGIETMIHVYGRDRNRMALQADMLAAHVLGLQNLIVVKGEPMANGDHRDAKAVDDLDEVGIIRMIKSLVEGVDLSGFELKGIPEFTTGCAMSAYNDDNAMAANIEQVKQYVDAGAQYIITPPVFDLDHCAKLLEKLKPLNVPVIPTVFLLKSVGIARYISINEPGAHISEDMIQRIRKAPDRETECLRIAGELASGLKKMANGVKIVTLGWEHRIPAILDYAGV